jgi:hypothetical protein
MSDKKATGDDDVLGAVLELLGEDGLKIMTKPKRNIYIYKTRVAKGFH